VRGSLRRNFSWTLAGNLAYAGCQWAVVVAIAKLGSPELVGKFTLAVAVCAPIMLAAGLGLRTVQANDVGRERPFSIYLGLRVATTLAAVVAIALVAVVGYRGAVPVVLAYAVAKSAEAISEIIWGQLQQQERMAQIARSMVAKGVTSVIGVTLALALTHDLVVATSSRAVLVDPSWRFPTGGKWVDAPAAGVQRVHRCGAGNARAGSGHRLGLADDRSRAGRGPHRARLHL